MSKIVSDPRLPTVNDEKIRPLTQRLYELFRQYAIAHNKSYMWDTEGTAAPTTGTWAISQMCKNTNPTTAIIGWVCTASGTPGTWVEIDGGIKREMLSNNRTYYVRTDGSDSNNGFANTSGGAFLTIQKAVNVVCGLDMSTYQVTISIADGTYSGGAELYAYVGSKPPLIIGNVTTPSNVVVSTSSLCFSNLSGFSWRIESLKVESSASHAIVSRYSGSSVLLVSIYFGTMGSTYSHMVAEFCAYIDIEGNYTISGSAESHILVQNGASFKSWLSSTVTITGTPNFVDSFAVCRNGGTLRNSLKTFSGSATGQRYAASMNGVILTIGGGANYFPGNVAGTTATGGQYD